MQFAVKCTKHFPGYEKAHASSIEQVKEQAKSWQGCRADLSTAFQVPDDFDMEVTKEGDPYFPIKEKLLSWQTEFQSKH